MSRTLPKEPTGAQIKVLQAIKENIVPGNGHAELSVRDLKNLTNLYASIIQKSLMLLKKKKIIRIKVGQNNRGRSSQKSKIYLLKQ